IGSRDLPFSKMLAEGREVMINKYSMVQPGEMIAGFPHIEQLLGVPFIIKGEPLAALCVMNCTKGIYNEHDKFFLENIATVGCTALSNTRTLRLLTDTGQHLDEAYNELNLVYMDLQSHAVIVDQVQEISRKIHSQTDLEQIFQELVGNVIHLLACEFCLVCFKAKGSVSYSIHSNNKLLRSRLNERKNKLHELKPFNRCFKEKQSLVDNDPSPGEKKLLKDCGLNLINCVFAPLVMNEKMIGFMAGFNKRNKGCFSDTDKYLIQSLGSAAVTVIMNSDLIRELKQLFEKSIAVLANSIEARDAYTRGHTDRVTSYTISIARQLGWDNKKLEQAYIGTTLHDIGKIGIPDAVLNKPSRLSEDEFAMMKKHVMIGVNILKDIGELKQMMGFIHHHHERYDGFGYPEGLSGEKISLEGRIVAVADSFDAMTSTRPYRQAMSIEQAVEELERCSGTQFDPEIVKTFIRLLESGALDKVLKNARQGEPAMQPAREPTHAR
ncbi:MAG: HD domain-containing protein, partial [Gemmatimonadota bacterium]|nr:HD domain-containing protein [Gemmatimonadota bacterium]